MLACDNVLWSGAVVPGMPPVADRRPEDTDALAAFNQHLSADPRFQTVWVPVGDGLSISTKV